MIDQIGIAVFGVTAIALSQSKNREAQKWASIFGLAGQPFWVWHAVSSGAYGIILLCPLYAAAWARGFWNFWLSPYLSLWKLYRLAGKQLKDYQERYKHIHSNLRGRERWRFLAVEIISDMPPDKRRALHRYLDDEKNGYRWSSALQGYERIEEGK